MTSLLNADVTFVTVFDYPLSYLEFFGTLLYLLSVYLIARRNMLTWPIGLASVVLFMLLFYQTRLYSAAAEQLYYLAACGYGWWYWRRPADVTVDSSGVMFSPPEIILRWLAAGIVLSLALGMIMSKAHLWSPSLFPEIASYPFVDAMTTVFSLIAMWLLARKKVESWLLWIAVDAVSVWLYFAKDLVFVALLYVLLLGIAIGGLIGWKRASRRANTAAGMQVAEAEVLPRVQ